MGRTTAVSLLHLFNQACNLVNQVGDAISLVTPQIGPGPFAAVLPVSSMQEIISSASSFRVESESLFINSLEIDIMTADMWQPQPDWRAIRGHCAIWGKQQPAIAVWVQQKRMQRLQGNTAVSRRLHQLEAEIVWAVQNNQLDRVRYAVERLAGLGPGLTPAGDDFLMGMMYGLWATRPEEVARFWADVVVKTAVPRTTTLSAAWLKAAARGEAVAAWHELGRWLVRNESEWETAVNAILQTGHSSGADALAGFTAVIGNAQQSLF
ncbi:MAG: DUF2877 domain-containing protein [Anaerolineales bacterium]|nr:DUF2877 domain-containing protein [Anaerolineales bacterium]